MNLSDVSQFNTEQKNQHEITMALPIAHIHSGFDSLRALINPHTGERVEGEAYTKDVGNTHM